MSGTINSAGDTTLSTPGTYTETVATTGTYNITLYGGEGGAATTDGQAGGVGAEIGDSISLTAGEELIIVVGANGVPVYNGNGTDNGTGGDATIIYAGSTSDVLAVAGGGGGAGATSGGVDGAVVGTGANPNGGMSGLNYIGGGSVYGGAGGTGQGNGATGFTTTSSGNQPAFGGQGGYGVLTSNGTLAGTGGTLDTRNGAPNPNVDAGDGGGGYAGGGGGADASGGGGGGSFFLSPGYVPTINTDAAAPDDSSGGEVILVGPLCFLAGTLIETAAGALPVEQVRVGDLVRTSTGVEKPVTWVGQARIMVPARRRNCGAPVIIRAGAFGNGVPFADLHVTAGHSFLFDNVLIPAEFLVNHRSIVWDDRAQEIEIFHIELEDHAVLIANGAPAKSYRDDGNRWLFHNHNPGWDMGEKPACAPVLTGGPVVDKVWRRLLDLCGPGESVELTDDPDLHVLADGVRVEARRIGRDVYAFDLAAACGELVLASRAAAQDELALSRDPRVLGVAVRRIVLWGDSWPVVLDADHADLRDGFHKFEAGEEAIWTNGRGVIPMPATHVQRVQVELAGRTRYRAGDLVARRVA